MIRPLVILAALFGLVLPPAQPANGQQPPPDDVGNAETRKMCIVATGVALQKIGKAIKKKSGSMIHAHTLRSGALSCFMTIDNVSYLIVLNRDDGKFTKEGFVVQYELKGFNSFEIE